jgi:SOS response regulatory protein OraA/RecX
MPPWPWSTNQRRTAEEEVTAHLRRLVVQRARIEHEIDAEIDRLTGRGFSWGTIARALRVTRQAARQRAIRRQAEGL